MITNKIFQEIKGQIGIYSGILWLIFAVFCYIFLVYSVGFFMFWRVKSKKRFYDVKALIFEKVLAFLNLSGQVGTVIMFIYCGTFANEETIPQSFASLDVSKEYILNLYYSFLIYNSIFIVLYLIFFFLFSNNLAIKFDDEKMYLIGISVWNTSFISLNKTQNKNCFFKYVYKSDANKNWTETIRFFSFFPSTKFLLENYQDFINLESNSAFFNLSQKQKEDLSQVKTKETSSVKSAKEISSVKKTKEDSSVKSAKTK